MTTGAVRAEAVAAICDHMGPKVDRLIWEAPLKNQQTFLIQQFGPNVNLGNIQTGEVLALRGIAGRIALRNVLSHCRGIRANRSVASRRG